MPTRPPAARSESARPNWLRYLIKHRLGLLLALEAFAIFAIAPLIELGMLPHLLLGTTFTLIILVGMLMLDLRSWSGRVLVLLGLAVLPVQLWRYTRPDGLVEVLHPIGLICFLLIVSAALANEVFRSRRVKIDHVLGGVVLYLNIGLTFAVVYTLVEHISPGSFMLPQPVPGLPVHPSYFTYFSFVTLTTVGYGDTLPVNAMARSLATLEAALGQLYPAIILARLVSIEVSQRHQRAASQDRHQVAQDKGRAARHL